MRYNHLHYTIEASTVNLFNEKINHFSLIKDKINIQEFVSFISTLVDEDSLISLMIISLPGICQNGIISICDYEDLCHMNLIEAFQHLDIDISIENDVNVSAIGFSHEHKEYQNVALLYQPSKEYSGCGLIINHKLYNGFSHFAGEVRYSPMYSHEEQDELLKTNPFQLLKDQIQMLICILNPEIIGVCSDVIDDITTLEFQDLPSIHLPKIIEIDDLNHFIELGLYRIALNILKNKGE